MPRKRVGTEQIITKLRQAEVELSRGLRPPQVCKKLGVSEQTYYRWRKEYGGRRVDQAKRLKTLEQENARLKRVVADQALDNLILKEVARLAETVLFMVRDTITGLILRAPRFSKTLTVSKKFLVEVPPVPTISPVRGLEMSASSRHACSMASRMAK